VPNHLDRDRLGQFDGHNECIVVREMIPEFERSDDESPSRAANRQIATVRRPLVV